MSTGLRVCVVGIGAMGGGIARALLASASTATVSGYDVSPDLVVSFHEEAAVAGKAAPKDGGGGPPSSLGAALSEADAVVLGLVNEAQCDVVCFGEEGSGGEDLADLLEKGACVILCSTVTATWAKKAAIRFASRGVRFVDCPISGGPARARSGDLTLIASGDEESLSAAMPLLEAAGNDVHIIPGGAGMGSTVKMVHQLLAGVHVAVAAEALALAATAGVDVRQMYDIVNGAAGASWMFADRGKRMIGEDVPPVMSAVDIFVKDLGIVHSEAMAVRSPVPIASAVLQQFVSAQGLGLGREDDSRVVKVYETMTGVPVGGKGPGDSVTLPSTAAPTKALDVCVIGIGAMGGGIARALLRSSATRTVAGYDRAETLVSAFFDDASVASKSHADTRPDSLGAAVTCQTDAVFLVLVNERQCEEVCFGGDNENLVSILKSGACIVLCSTVTATWARKAQAKFASAGILFLDCPVSGGPARAKSGELTMMASGDEESLSAAVLLLKAVGKDVHIISGGAGMGSTVKMVHQLLAGVHIVAAAEALALAAKMGVDVEQMYDIVNGAAGASWMFADRGKRMISKGEPAVMSTVDIFVKDLGIVLSEAMALKCPIPIATAALQQFISAQALGLGMKDDSQVTKVYEHITGVQVGKAL